MGKPEIKAPIKDKKKPRPENRGGVKKPYDLEAEAHIRVIGSDNGVIV
jgi:hypothetical protein